MTRDLCFFDIYYDFFFSLFVLYYANACKVRALLTSVTYTTPGSLFYILMQAKLARSTPFLKSGFLFLHRRYLGKLHVRRNSLHLSPLPLPLPPGLAPTFPAASPLLILQRPSPTHSPPHSSHTPLPLSLFDQSCLSKPLRSLPLPLPLRTRQSRTRFPGRRRPSSSGTTRSLSSASGTCEQEHSPC